jgi:AraC-like DNA-binding protein
MTPGKDRKMITGAENNFKKNARMEMVEKYRLVTFAENSGSRLYEILPDAYFDLSFLFSESDCKVFLAGPYTEKTNVPIGGYDLFIVSFRVGRMPMFLEIRPYELVNTMIELTRINGIDVDSIGEKLMIKKDLHFRQNFIEELLCQVEFTFMKNNHVYEQATAIIEACGGRIRVGDVSRMLNVSNRTLERQFKATLGFSPKRFIRLVRFQKVIEKLQSGYPFSKTTDIAYEFDYTDQSHLIRDFKSLAGILPSSFQNFSCLSNFYNSYRSKM